MKRTPSPEDLKALRWAGLMEHRYVVTRNARDGGRHVCSEQDDLRGWNELMPGRPYDQADEPRAFEQIQFSTRRGRRWRRVR